MYRASMKISLLPPSKYKMQMNSLFSPPKHPEPRPLQVSLSELYMYIYV